jgi:hypothetical protein
LPLLQSLNLRCSQRDLEILTSRWSEARPRWKKNKCSHPHAMKHHADGNRYAVEICASNLGATDRDSGNAILKHCFLKIVDGSGGIVETLAFGPGGVSAESYPDVPSVRCYVHAAGLNAPAVAEVERRFHACADRGYSWADNNCCSCAIEAVESALGVSCDAAIREAATTIEESPDPFQR